MANRLADGRLVQFWLAGRHLRPGETFDGRVVASWVWRLFDPGAIPLGLPACTTALGATPVR
jgi:hypothetical protein